MRQHSVTWWALAGHGDGDERMAEALSRPRSWPYPRVASPAGVVLRCSSTTRPGRSGHCPITESSAPCCRWRSTIGDHVWVMHWPHWIGDGDDNGARGVGECCNPMPPVVEFDATGAVVQAWGGCRRSRPAGRRFPVGGASRAPPRPPRVQAYPG